MALHLLLFTSDAHIALVLGKLLSEFEIEVEFCSDALGSVEKVTQNKFDAIIVDWDDGPEATFLLKTARELKSTRECVSLALVSDVAAGACAVQIGAHGILNKPIVPEQVRETIGTIRDMLLSPQDSAAASAPAPSANDSKTTPSIEVVGPLEQSSAAIEKSQEESAAASPKPAFLNKEARELPSLPPMPKVLEPPLQEASVGTIFASTPYIERPVQARVRARNKKGGKTGTRIAVMAGLLLTAAAFYVWAPGTSYFERITAMGKSLLARRGTEGVVAEIKPAPSTEKNTSSEAAANASSEPEAAIPATITEDTSNIQITPVTEPSDMNTGAPRPFRPTGPVGIKTTGDTSVAAVDSSANAVSIKQPTMQEASDVQTPATGAPAPVPKPTAPATPASAAAVPPSVIAAVDHAAGDVPRSLLVSAPINPVQAAVASTPAMSAGNSLTTTVLPEETARELLVKKVQPIYPEQAIRSGVQGAVILQAWIAKDGSIRDVKLLRGSFVLARAAVDAVRQWQFKPYMSNGQATEVQTTITVGFKLPTTVVNMGAPSDSPKP